MNKNITDDKYQDLFVKHTYKHNSHIKLMYIYLLAGKRAYFEIYSERFVFNGNKSLLLFIGAFQITVSIPKSCMYTVKFSG